MTGIIDYGMGNLLSVHRAVEWTGRDAMICTTPEDLDDCERLILPGVGAFCDCLRNLRQAGMAAALQQHVRNKGKPLLGICLGMQALADVGYEGGETTGLGWFDAKVELLSPSDTSLRIPHVGWNEVTFLRDHPLGKGVPAGAEFYFVHSYWMHCAHEGDILATVDYGGQVTAAVARDNVVATQFHPEKSQEHGLRVLENFLTWKP